MSTSAIKNSAALYVRDGEGFAPTGVGASPWLPDTQGGVPLAGLVAHAIETVPQPSPMQVTRLTIDILGAVPQLTLFPKVCILREGRRLQLLEIELQASGRTWVRATALRVRTEETPNLSAPLARALPEAIGIASTSSALAESIHVAGGPESPGIGARWVRIIPTVVEGLPLSALERTAMIADWGSGVSNLLSRKLWSLANVDISIHISRLPKGEWLLVDSTSESAGNGIGIASARLGDRDGIFASSHQTVFLDRRPVRPA